MQQTPQANGSWITLRPHQAEAVDAIVRGLSHPAGGTMPVGGLRGQVHMATGTGKTITAARAARKLCPAGVIGVLVPTLDLLTQTIEAWRRVGHTGPAVAVCSLGADPLLEALGVRCTTNPTQLALWASDGPMLVFATYASLASQGLADEEDDAPDATAPGVLEQALRGTYGQRMAPFDLVVVDEAHRTSGNAAKAWACVHDQDRIPAARRLYMTATPRLWEAAPRTTDGEEADDDQLGSDGTAGVPQSGGEALGGRLVASMDDVELYGPVLHETGLMEAVERGILARFEVDVLEIRDPSPIEEDASLEERRGRRLAALQAALLKHADESGTRSYMTFHSRTLDAMAFARAMPETAARLHAADPAAYPARVGAEWLSGEHPATHRRDVLARYADGLDAEGWVTGLSFLASCRVLGEGVDIRGKRGVGAVVFADTRSSPVEIVQIIGRALRQEPGDGKISRIVVPVFLEPGEDPGDMMASSSYRPLVAILQGLRAHDDRVIERMALPTTTARGQITSVLALDPQQPSPADENDDQDDEHDGQEQDGERETAAGTETRDDDDRDDQDADEDDEDQGDETDAAPGIAPVTTPLLRFSLPRDPQAVALFLRTRVLRPDSEIWLTGYNALRTFAAEHGHAQVPRDTTVELGDGDGTYGLGSWVSEQRRAFKAGTLRAWRADLLNEIGMVWSVGDAAFWKNLGAARRYHAVHGSLACPKGAVWEGVPVGQWLSNLRRPGGLGADPVRADERRRALEAIAPDWNPTGWSVDWQRHYAAARVLLAEEQGPGELLPGITVNGCDVGTWTRRQTDPAVWDTLSPEQQKRLTALGLTPRPAAPTATTAAAKGGAFERGITALTQYAAREGRIVVPRAHIEETPHGPVRLGTWISNTRSRRNKLTDQQREQLTALGIDWAQEATA
ncbi:DEAD/DEAH box helicase [Streptomyces sp. ID01-9D]|uniref:DEAD/DEAH box helicase n=1 Tax=Streptomyces sp. ID01-9D TaxID=3028659 RepID=UPI0029C26F85|nr:Helicase associated domain protein [Streptomyces sp. ID01-9D]MDX5575528.1 Helicase associated domain protein [Streptomyces sp. ID01-9D]